MTVQASYTQQEWQLLEFAPLWVFAAVAGADSKVDDKEMEAFLKDVSEAALYKEPLVREVLMSLGSNFAESMTRFREDSRPVDRGLADVASLLDRKSDNEEANNFKKAVVGIGLDVARASGRIFGDNMSKEEKQALVIVASALRVEL